MSEIVEESMETGVDIVVEDSTGNDPGDCVVGGETITISSECLEAVSSALGQHSDATSSTFATLSDGTVVEIVALNDYEFPNDQNLHDAANLILECAQSLPDVNVGTTSSNVNSDVVETVKTTEKNTDTIEDAGSELVQNELKQFVVLEEAADESQRSSENQVQIIRDEEQPRKAYCTGCNKTLEYKNRRRHLMLVHRITGTDVPKMNMSKCIHPDCDKEFYTVKSMMKHLENDHAVNVETKEMHFDTWEQFFEWKNMEEDTNFVFFSKRSGECIRAGKMVNYFICQRDGNVKPHRSKDYVPTGRTNKKGRARQNTTCPARIKTYYRHGEGVKVFYTFSHNHSISSDDTIHHPLSKSTLDKIRKRLQKGVCSERVSQIATSSLPGSESHPILTKRRIDGIKKKLDRENRLCAEETASVHLLITRLQKQQNSPIVIYTCEGVYESEGHIYTEHMFDPTKLFLILYRSMSQLEMMAAFAGRLLIVDTDGSMDNNGNHLVNILVSDEFHRAYPVAHIITNNVELGLKVSLRTLKESIPNVDFDVIFTPNEAFFPLTIDLAFNTNFRYFCGRWETIRQWEKRIKSSVFSSALRRDLSQMLGMLLDENDPARFEILLEVFMKEFVNKADRFLRMFEKHYAFAKRAWAKCYRQFGQYGTDRPDYMRKFLSRLDWWVSERPSNKRIDDLVNLLVRIDEEWQTERSKDFHNYPSMVDRPMCKHAVSSLLSDDTIHPVKLTDGRIRVWYTGGDEENPAYVVKLLQDSCELDFCWDRCDEDSCSGLCGHLYSCSCDDGTGLCEHIHKVRSFCHKSGDGVKTTNSSTLYQERMEAGMATEEWPEGMKIVVLDADGNEAEDVAQYVQMLPQIYAQLAGDGSDAHCQVALETTVETSGETAGSSIFPS